MTGILVGKAAADYLHSMGKTVDIEAMMNNALSEYSSWQLHQALNLGRSHMPTDPARKAEIEGFMFLILAELDRRNQEMLAC